MKLFATWEDVWEELPPDVRLALEPAKGTESQTTQTASLFGETVLSAHERKIMALLKPDEARHIDEIVERSCLLPKSSPRCLSWNWRAELSSCRERIL